VTNLLLGTAGDDTLLADTASATLDGGTGWDTADFSAAGTGVRATLYGLGYAGDAWWNPMPDSIVAYSLISVEGIIGSAHGDSLQGGYAAVAFDGAGGDDTLAGSDQADRLSGGDGNDLIYGMRLGYGETGLDSLDGGAGDDTLQGQAGETLYTGGSGADLFLVLNNGGFDRITDFAAAAGDRLGFPGAAPSLPELPGHTTGATVTLGVVSFTTAYDTTGFLPYDDSHRPLAWLGAVAPVAALAAGLALAPSELTAAIHGLSWVPEVAGGGWLVLDRDGDGRYGAADDVIRLDGVPGFGPEGLAAGAAKPITAGSAGDDHLAMPLVSIDPFQYYMEHGTAAPPPTSYLVDGGAGDDTLEGGNGNDTLSGGSGDDWLAGGLGADTYLVDSQAGLIFEASGLIDYGDGTYSFTATYQDRDTAIASVGYQLYANVEDLVLAAAAGDAYGVGNEAGNVITGNAGANLLIGLEGDDTLRGGGGADALFGGEGDDSLDGGTGLDTLLGGAGRDTLLGGGGPDELYGEDGDDSLSGGADFVFDLLVGGAGNDTLDGASGLGDYDYLHGGTGGDAYYVDTPADLVFEFAGEGNDTVYAGIDGAGYYLYAEIEDLVLLGATPFGVGNSLGNHITGSSTANWLLGGAGDDTLNGEGGNDVLFGEAGADVFVFGRGTGGDVIGDFTPGEDGIELRGLGLTGFAQLAARISVVGGDAAIDLGQGDFIVIRDVTGFTAGDFLFA
jgi:Ca2+-binding RTX toxin-like protein